MGTRLRPRGNLREAGLEQQLGKPAPPCSTPLCRPPCSTPLCSTQGRACAHAPGRGRAVSGASRLDLAGSWWTATKNLVAVIKDSLCIHTENKPTIVPRTQPSKKNYSESFAFAMLGCGERKFGRRRRQVWATAARRWIGPGSSCLPEQVVGGGRDWKVERE